MGLYLEHGRFDSTAAVFSIDVSDHEQQLSSWILIQFGVFELRSLLDREILWGEFTDLQALSSGYLQHRCDRGGGV